MMGIALELARKKACLQLYDRNVCAMMMFWFGQKGKDHIKQYMCVVMYILIYICLFAQKLPLPIGFQSHSLIPKRNDK